jgi:glycosyltransferase involved in cell wall biosynthesis
MCNQLGLKGKVRVLGTMPHEELVSLYSEADIFVLASVVAPSGDRDGIPNAILEAMASSLPVVASAISGIPEAVLDGKTGLLVPQRNPEAMADAVEKLANAPDLRQELGRAGRKLGEEKFNIEKNCRDLAKIFRRQTG